MKLQKKEIKNIGVGSLGSIDFNYVIGTEVII